MARTLVVLASLVIVAALVAGYARHTAVDSDQFANRATAALRDESVKTLAGDRITDEVVLKNQADLLAARPIISSIAAEVVGGRAFTSLFRTAVRDVHRALFERNSETVTMTVADVGTVLAAALEQFRPELAERLESTRRVELVRTRIGTLGATLAEIAERIRRLAVILLVVAVGLVGAALTISRDRRNTVVELGIATSVVGVLMLVAYAVGRSVAVGHVDGPEAQAAAEAVWDAFLGDLRTALWILAGTGAVLAAAAGSLIEPRPLGQPLRVAGAWLSREPRRPALRVLRALVLVAAGVLVLAEREAALALLLTALGIYLIYEGVSALLRLVYRPEEEEASRRAVRGAGRHGVRGMATVAIPAVLIGAVLIVFLRSDGVTTAAPADGPCNGHVELCDRPLTRVALATTHNSMSVPLRGWFSSAHEEPIAGQLRAGIRGLLIDTHYADRLPNGRVRTFFAGQADLEKRVKVDGVSPAAVQSAGRIREQLGFRGQGERGIYLCHSFCELGATPLGPVLRDVRDFLVASPGAVLVVVNQDYVAPEDFVGAVRDAGLERFAYGGPVTGSEPTLREMIESGKRVLFLAENRAGAAPWYRPAYRRLTEETPYSFSQAVQLTRPSGLEASCRPNRGPEGAPLFLLNHWVTTDPVPRPSDAVKVNAYDALLARARECERTRDHVPNLVAVNFSGRGDLLRVVDALNGVP
jgi:hypothetical protein